MRAGREGPETLKACGNRPDAGPQCLPLDISRMPIPRLTRETDSSKQGSGRSTLSFLSGGFAVRLFRVPIISQEVIETSRRQLPKREISIGCVV